MTSTHLLKNLSYTLPLIAVMAPVLLSPLSLNAQTPEGGDLVVAPPVPRKSAVAVTKESEERLAWWREARFGLFIHYGLYSISGGGGWDLWHQKKSLEEYAQLTKDFKAEKFVAQDWVSAAESAGMKYAVLVTKHHDGFALFDSKDYPFNSVNSAAKKDIVKEFVDACHKVGMRVGLYYSPLDWQYPGYFFPDLYLKSAEAMREKYHSQIEQLMTNYGKVDLLWYDGGGPNWLAFGGLEYGGSRPGWHDRDRSKGYSGKFNWQDDQINTKARTLQPALIINDRTATPADFESREGETKIGEFNDKIPWELCTTLASTWGYQSGRSPMSLEKCIRLLANTAGRDGNLLLNVGPRPDGQIEPDQLARLKEIGDWMRVHGESIYGTRGGPFLPGKYGATTRKGNQIFVHWIAPGSKLKLPKIPAKVQKVSVLGSELVPAISETENGLEVSLPMDKRPAIDTVLVLDLDKPAKDVPLMELEVYDRANLDGVKLEKDIDYLDKPHSPKADLYSPEKRTPGQLCPAVVIIHGGGWGGGDKSEAREQNIGATLARNGYVGMSINYVLGDKEAPVWPKNLQQCKTAVRWLRKNAARLGIDPDRIGVIGGSAGGHLAAMMGVTGPFDGFDPEGPYGEYSCQVQAVVDMYGPVDLMNWRDSMSLFGKTRAEVPELYQQATPMNYLRKGQPPFLLLHGTADTTVDIEQSRTFAKALEKAGVDYQFVVVDGGIHTFDLQPPQKDLRPVVLGFFDRFLKKK